MPEEKIKIKDLAGELDVQSKDMLRALRELGLPAKSTAGSVSVEDAARLRGHFAGQKQGGVERTEVQPNVIVRRRRKDAEAAPAPEAKAPEAEAAPSARPEAESAPAVAESSAKAEGPAAEADAAESVAARPVESKDADAPAPTDAEASAPKPQKTARVVAAARVISRPGDEAARAAEPVAAAAPVV